MKRYYKPQKTNSQIEKWTKDMMRQLRDNLVDDFFFFFFLDLLDLFFSFTVVEYA